METPLLPVQASEEAVRVDLLMAAVTAVAAFFSILIAVLVVRFAVRYRSRPGHRRAHRVREPLLLELTWIAVPLLISIWIFWWGATVFVDIRRGGDHPLEIYVVGKQWMWKLQHPSGRREINQLHVPVGRPVRLLLASEDVIHSFFVPAFRVKMDTVPGRYTTLSFTPTRTGSYHLFCAEYCGTGHSGMGGQVVVMEADEFQAWLEGSDEPPMAESGGALFERLGCAKCHQDAATARGPSLRGLFGSRVRLEDGRTVTADEGYLRRSILQPDAELVAGYKSIMPAFKGQVDEEAVARLIAYIKDLEPVGGEEER